MFVQERVIAAWTRMGGSGGERRTLVWREDTGATGIWIAIALTRSCNSLLFIWLAL